MKNWAAVLRVGTCVQYVALVRFLESYRCLGLFTLRFDELHISKILTAVVWSRFWLYVHEAQLKIHFSWQNNLLNSMLHSGVVFAYCAMIGPPSDNSLKCPFLLSPLNFSPRSGRRRLPIFGAPFPATQVIEILDPLDWVRFLHATAEETSGVCL